MDLKELIATTKGDRSYEDLSQAAGGSPQGARWWQLATDPLKVAPTPSSIRGIARGLGVTEQTVWLAVGVSLGLAVEDRNARLLQLLPAGTETLPDDAVASILSLIRVLVRQTRAQAEAEAAAAAPAPPEPTPIRARKKSATKE